MPETFRLAYVPGATPGKWASVWRERLPDVALELVQVEPADAQAALRDGRADAAIARLPVDTDVFSRIPLYEEVPVVCVHREHFLAALDPDETVAPADLADETVWLPQDDVLYGAPRPAGPVVPGQEPVDPDGVPLERPATAEDVLAVVAAGAGITVLPMSLARLHHRKDVVYRPLDGGPAAPVGLVWPMDRTTDLVEEMIGIVRGRTVNSSRGSGRSRSSGEAGAVQADGPSAKSQDRGASRGGKSAAARDRGASRSGKGGDRSSAGQARRRGQGASSARKKGPSKNKKRRNG